MLGYIILMAGCFSSRLERKEGGGNEEEMREDTGRGGEGFKEQRGRGIR